MMTVLRNSLSATVLIIVIVLVRTAALQKLPKNTFCVLWIGAALRLLLPASIESEYSVYTLLNGLLRKRGGEMGTIVGTISMEEVRGEMAGASGGMIPILEILWLTGVCVMTAFFLISFIRSMRKFRRSTPVECECGEFLPAKRLFPVEIRQSEEITGPLTYGVFRPVILLPHTTDWEDQEKLSCVLSHECAHIRRHDCLVKLLFVAALCVHWFNPVVWLLCLLANRDIELACDEAAIRSLGAENRFSYARALLYQTEHASGFPLFSHFGTQGIGERIASVLRPQRRSVWCMVLACLLVVGTLTVFGTGPARNPEAETAVPESTSGDVQPRETITAYSAFVSKTGDARPQESVTIYSMFTSVPNESIPKDYTNVTYGFAPDDADEIMRVITPEGKNFVLKPGQWFVFQLNDEVLQQGVVNGSVYELTPDKEPTPVAQASAEVRVISQDPMVVEVCGERFVLSMEMNPPEGNG